MSKDFKTERLRLVIDENGDGLRMDKALSMLESDLSRSRIKNLIEAGQVLLNRVPCADAARKVKSGDEVVIDIPPPEPAQPQPENIPLDVVYEDEDLLVLNKPAGLVVHPGAGNYTGTLVNALLYHCGDSLSGIGGVLRPGIVHRLDKDTSGLMIVAKNDRTHRGLAAQLEDRSLSRLYKALVFKIPVPLKATIDQPVGRHHVNRQQMTINRKNGRDAQTHYHVIERFGEACSLIECKLQTGRTHQIRVHMEFIKHNVIGDPLYGAQSNAITAALKKSDYNAKVVEAVLAFPRQALHAQGLSFIHPSSGEEVSLETDLPGDINKLLKLLRK